MPVNITVRSVPDDVHQRLASRAAQAGQSMQQYLTAELTRLAARPSTREALTAIEHRLRGYPAVDHTVDDVVRHLDADRR
jgi:plasmid stability protein